MQLLKSNFVLVVCFNLSALLTFAQGTSFSYQGRFTAGGREYTGSAEFRPTLWDAPRDGKQIALNAPSEITVAVTNGLFVLPLDFGANFPGPDRWLQLDVRTNKSEYTVLDPRQPVTPAPYALTAATLSGLVPASQLTGSLPSANLGGAYSNVLNFNNLDNLFFGNGAGLAGLNADALASGSVPDARISANIPRTNQVWLLGGNAGVGLNQNSLGTTDETALELKVNGSRALRLEPGSAASGRSNIVNVIAGSSRNNVGPGVVGATIAGGGAEDFQGYSDNRNFVNSHFATIGGGRLNTVDEACENTTIAGGFQNSVALFCNQSAIGGGFQNKMELGSGSSTIAGGVRNVIESESPSSTIAGGYANVIETNSLNSTIGGGTSNTILPQSQGATIPGGELNTAGPRAFAAGYRAKAVNTGAFVWADSTDTAFTSTADNQFLIRASGGVGIGTPNPQGALHVYSPSNPTVVRVQSSGTPGFGRVEFVSDPQGSGSEWRPGFIQSSDNGGFTGGLGFCVNGTGSANRFGAVEVMRVVNGRVGIGTTTPASELQVVGTVTATAINPSSDRNLKENFAAIDPADALEKVLALPITRWNFKNDSSAQHIGPMAQDFHAAFGTGANDRHIATVDADGVALAAIQGLNQKLEQKDAEITELKQSVSELKALVMQLSRKIEGGAQ